MRYNIWNAKMAKYDILIDLAEIKHLSIKMLTTGRISKKVLKKWRKRDRFNTMRGRCTQCSWLPDTIVYKKKALTWRGKAKMWWCCRKCRCSTAWVYEDEISAPMLEAYREYTRKRDEE